MLFQFWVLVLFLAMHTSPSKKIDRIPVILLAALIIISLPFSPLFQPFGYDREIFRYAGMLVTKGYLPYRDIFDHKPPLIYFISALAHLFGPWGFWVVSNILTFITSIVIFRFVRTRFKSYAFILVVPLVYIFLSRYELVYEGGGLTREYTQTFATLIIFLRITNQRIRFFIIGLLYGLIFLTQQNEILAITLIAAYFIVWNNEERKLKKFSEIFSHGLLFAASSIGVCAIFAGYFYLNGALDALIEQAFLFNTTFYVRPSFYEAFSDTWMSYYYIFPNFTLFAILYIIFARYNKNMIEYGVFFLAMFVQLGASSLGYRFGHYYLSFIPYFCYSTYFALTHFEDKVAAEYHRIIACAAFFLFILPMTVILRFKAIAQHKYWSYYSQRSECYEIVKDVKGKDGQLFVFNNPSYLAINTDLNVASQSKLAYFHFYNNVKFDPDNRMFYEMVETLEKNRCKYIIDFSAYNKIGREELQNHWYWFLDTKYHVIHENMGNYRILEINATKVSDTVDMK